MELLVITLAEIAAQITSVAVAFIINILSLFVFIVLSISEYYDPFSCLDILLRILFSRDDQSSRFRRKSILRKVAVIGVLVCSTIFVLFILTIAIVNSFFFESTLRCVLRHVEKRTNIAIEFDATHGNLFTGQVSLNGLRVKRENHPLSRFDFTGENVEIDISVSKLLFCSVVFESVKISNFSGTWEQVGKSDTLKPRRRFRIDNLEIDAVEMVYIDRTRESSPLEVSIKIDTMVSKPLRSNWGAFDFFFRSKGTGSVNEIPFVVDSKPGKHFFHMNDVPIELLNDYIGVEKDAADLWFDTGKADFKMENDLHDGVIMHGSVIFHDFQMKIPEKSFINHEFVTKSMETFWESPPKRIPLKFEFRWTNEDFHLKSTAELNATMRDMLGEKITSGLKNAANVLKMDFGTIDTTTDDANPKSNWKSRFSLPSRNKKDSGNEKE